jgi:hypothetical protein
MHINTIIIDKNIGIITVPGTLLPKLFRTLIKRQAREV